MRQWTKRQPLKPTIPLPLPPAEDSNRRTGRTTGQMKASELCAIFVWCNDHLHYARRLAHDLGRDDITIKSWHWLSSDPDMIRGIGHQIVIDHAAIEVNSDDPNLAYAFEAVRMHEARRLTLPK